MKTLARRSCILLALGACGTRVDLGNPGAGGGTTSGGGAATTIGSTGSGGSTGGSTSGSTGGSTGGSSADSGVVPISDAGGFCSYGGVNYRPGSTFPASDDCNSCRCSESGQTQCTRCACMRPESGPTPAEPGARCGSTGGDGGASSDGGACQECAGAKIVWYSDGGRRFSYESSVLTPCRSYQHFRNDHPGDGMPLACFQELPGCGVPGLTWGRDLARVLSHPDMVAALAAAPVIYGGDPRPFDGSVFHMEIGGKIVEVGPDVAPAGVRAAETFLLALENEQLATGNCRSAFRPDAGPSR